MHVNFCYCTFVSLIMDCCLFDTHWNKNVVILTKFSSLAALEVVILTTSSAASDEHFIKMKTFPFQWLSHYWNQYWLIVNWTLRNKNQWSLNKIPFFFQKIYLEMSSTKWQLSCIGFKMSTFTLCRFQLIIFTKVWYLQCFPLYD